MLAVNLFDLLLTRVLGVVALLANVTALQRVLPLRWQTRR